jgi:hypothetical protein
MAFRLAYLWLFSRSIFCFESAKGAVDHDDVGLHLLLGPGFGEMFGNQVRSGAEAWAALVQREVRREL